MTLKSEDLAFLCREVSKLKTQYYTATSLDGFIATEDDSLDWLFTLATLGESSYPSFISQVGAIAMGSSTYEWMRRNVDQVIAETGNPWPYWQPTWVFSRRELQRVENADLRFVQGEVRPAFDDMKRVAEEKNIWIVGGGDLAGQFYDAGLLDELIVQVGSVTLGKGKPLLPRRLTGNSLKLVSVLQMGPGMVELRYEVNRSLRDHS